MKQRSESLEITGPGIFMYGNMSVFVMHASYVGCKSIGGFGQRVERTNIIDMRGSTICTELWCWGDLMTTTARPVLLQSISCTVLLNL